MQLTLIFLALAIILGLGFYAGKLLFQLKQQTQKQEQARRSRIDTITESIRTIALAMEQQQCDLSEGVIRICNLLDAIPVLPQPDYAKEYPATYGLHEKIRHFPTHDARNALTKQERRQQDKEREEIESQYESDVIKEVGQLKQLQV